MDPKKFYVWFTGPQKLYKEKIFIVMMIYYTYYKSYFIYLTMTMTSLTVRSKKNITNIK